MTETPAPPFDPGAEFDRQVRDLIGLGHPKAAGLDDERFADRPASGGRLIGTASSGLLTAGVGGAG
ncbi:hypothetical protein F0L17_12215 [Streptomyces sp. TRM43335]|uniref:Uncharacterized protein n=1 Tax=Streptomyces taklimakanensis TaxID=2569853 RepID=A0A6G2BCL2_9ACTN|nr:hypothetical protein [Streptomyces taklimakanensis]MTE19866.1 hypothetical protein [Streptomyces taklimakanensis]